MKTKNLVLLCLLLAALFDDCYSQNVVTKIVDSKTNEEIPFATIRFYAGGKLVQGIVSNTDGSFQFPKSYQTEIDSIVVSCIGYANLVIPQREFGSRLNPIKLQEASVRLKEITVKGKSIHLSAHKIIKLAIENLKKNYPTKPYSYVGYYRDYQVEDTTYVNLNEAIVGFYDQGFGTDDLTATREKLFQYKENKTFPRDPFTTVPYQFDKNKFIPGVIVYPFGGNELSILRIHDALRNYNHVTFSFVNQFDTDFAFNHTFELVDTTSVNGELLYQISFESTHAAGGSRHQGKGEIFIDASDFAVHKLSYSAFELTQGGRRLYTVEVEYSRINSLMYLNYISFNNFFLARDSEGFAVKEVYYDKALTAFVVRFNSPPEPRSALTRSNYHFSLNDHPIDVIDVKIPTMNGSEVIIHLDERSGFSPTSFSDQDYSRIKASFKNIKDKLGREINESGYKQVNQFRELFVNKIFTSMDKDELGPFISNDLPLKQNKIDTTQNSVGYWMNTPLKKK